MSVGARMTFGHIGADWVGNALVSVVGVVAGSIGGWMMRRPIEKAGVLEAVNNRMASYMQHLEAELGRIAKAHQACEERLDAMDKERRHDRELTDQLRDQIRQEKQIGFSAARRSSGKPE